MAPKIIQEVELKGQEQVKKGFDEIREHGVGAFADINAEAGKTDLGVNRIGNLRDMAARLGISLEEAKAKILATSAATKALGGEAGAARSALGTFQALGARLSSVFSSIAASATAGSGSIKGFGQAIRGLGRATGATGLGRFGRSISVLGRNLQALAVPAVVVGLGVLANSAAKAADAIGDGAAAAGLSAQKFQEFTGAGISAGVSTEKMVEAGSKLVESLKSTKAATEAQSKADDEFKVSLATAKESASSASGGYSRLAEEGRKLVDQLREGKITTAEFAVAQGELNKQTADLGANITKQDQAVAKSVVSHNAAARAAEANATGLQKLGIAATNTQGKLLTQNEVLDALAEKFKGGLIPLEEMKLRLTELGLDRRLIPFLTEGAAGLAKMRAESERLAPKLTDVQLAIGDKMAAAMTTLGEVLVNLKNQFGLLFAPTFTNVINAVTEAFVKARPSILAFGQALANVLGPVFSAIGTVITTIVIPVFNFLAKKFEDIATLINKVFGTDLKGVDIFVGLIVAAAVALGGIPVIITAIIVGIGLLIENWQTIQKIVTDVVAAITDAWSQFFGKMDGWIQDMKFKLSQLNPFTKGGLDAQLGFGDIGKSGKQTNGFKGSGSTSSFAGGGRVFGGGTSTSDSISAFLSRDEFVHRAKAARYYGYGIMNAINDLAIPRDFFKHFAEGGQVIQRSMMPAPLRLASGGKVSKPAAMRALDVHFGGETFAGLLAPEDIADKMIRVSVGKQVRSGGKKPGWMR